jgi:hypothetical protein
MKKALLVILPEESHENLRSLEGSCLHWQLKKVYIDNLTEETLENLRSLEGGCLHWHLKKAYIDNFFCRKSRESQVLRGRLPSLAFGESL